MPSVTAYHRPETLAEAAGLLTGGGRRVIGGGTIVVPEARVATTDGVELVDLQGLDLGAITADGDRLRIGAMTRVGELVDSEQVPTLLQDLARRELPSTLRYQATLGGTVALASADSVLTAGLLAHDATVETYDPDLGGDRSQALAELLATGGVSDRIVTAITIDPAGMGAVAVTGRTPADDPIVAAVVVAVGAERRMALTGVADHPRLVDPDDPTAGLDPPGDFRGSADYRRHLATVLAARAVANATGADR